MKRFILSSSIAGLLLLTACGGANTDKPASAPPSNPVSGTATEGPESFIKLAAQSSMFQAEMAKLASTKAEGPAIKKFAQMVVTDHAAEQADLEKIASGKKTDLPKDVGPYQPTVDKLNKMSGADFDRYYVEQAYFGHESDLKVFKKQAESGTDADVKAFAAKGIPGLQKHLDEVKAIKEKMK